MSNIDLSVNPAEFIWFQKYRPTTVDDIILPEQQKKRIKSCIKKKEIPHYLLIGKQGTGKTTLAKAIANDLDSEVLFINASLENGIDVIRNRVADFISTVSFGKSGPKIVILDEADNISRAGQMSLRSLMEQFSKNARFILTGNYSSSIIPALHSRCQVIDFTNMIADEKERNEMYVDLYKRILKIFELENVEFDKKDTKQVKIIYEIIKNLYPDIRSILSKLQSFVVDGKIEVTGAINEFDGIMEELKSFVVAAKFTNIREWFGKHSDVEPETIFRFFYENIYESLVDQSKPDFIVLIGKYSYQNAICTDKEINLMAFVSEVLLTCNFK